MRVSVPNIPQTLLSSAQILPSVSVQEAIERVANFLAAGNVTVLTGAGVSVDSGIRAYRGKDGRYMNPNYKPIFYHELMDGTEKGRLYRNVTGYVHTSDILQLEMPWQIRRTLLWQLFSILG
ncbi:hypothetical protein MPER_06379 [Moniliophthora perniciosa FA553]|nr:hypothetical protein MPER_06379 [Moniliophthora perniciosa FA553]